MPIIHKTTTKNNKADSVEKTVAIFFVITVAIFFVIVALLICYFSMRMI